MNLRASKTATVAAKDTRSAPMDLDRRRLLKAAIAVPILPAIAGCSTLERGAAVPDALADRVTVLGIQNARYWPDTQGAAMAREAIAAEVHEMGNTAIADSRRI